MRASYAGARERCHTAAGLQRSAAACRACPAMVPGSAVLDLPPGPRPLLFIGEAPGRLGAARTGVPFSGDAAGARFERLLAEAGLSRADAAVTNAVLCLPLDERGRNRRPRPAEVRACAGYLRAVLELARPRLVVPLGAVALAALAAIEPHRLVLARDAGRPVPWRGRWLMPLYHPAARSAVRRPLPQQVEDWRRLGAFAARLPASKIPVDA
jgi:uracil-DNA glycosylase family 4